MSEIPVEVVESRQEILGRSPTRVEEVVFGCGGCILSQNRDSFSAVEVAECTGVSIGTVHTVLKRFVSRGGLTCVPGVGRGHVSTFSPIEDRPFIVTEPMPDCDNTPRPRGIPSTQVLAGRRPDTQVSGNGSPDGLPWVEAVAAQAYPEEQERVITTVTNLLESGVLESSKRGGRLVFNQAVATHLGREGRAALLYYFGIDVLFGQRIADVDIREVLFLLPRDDVRKHIRTAYIEPLAAFLRQQREMQDVQS